MLVPRIQRVKKRIVALLRELSPASGAQYAITVKEIDEAFGEPQGDVEVDITYEGDEPAEGSPLGASEIWMKFTIFSIVSKRQWNEDTPIDEAAMVVDADIWRAIMADPYQGGECQNTERLESETIGSSGSGFYSQLRRFRFLVSMDHDSNDRENPFTA